MFVTRSKFKHKLAELSNLALSTCFHQSSLLALFLMPLNVLHFYITIVVLFYCNVIVILLYYIVYYYYMILLLVVVIL